jgi:hypothetical protein
LFGKLYVLLGNLNHAEAFLEPAPVLFFNSNILDTVGSKMALLACNNPLEASTNPVEGTSTLSTAMGAQKNGQKSGVRERVGGLGAEFGILLVVGCSLATAGVGRTSSLHYYYLAFVVLTHY